MSLALAHPPSKAAADVLRGLTGDPKTLPSYLFYDTAGSELFEQITALPEYYLTRTEKSILDGAAGELAQILPRLASVIELGAGTAAKTTILLRALASRNPRLLYLPIDISASALEQASRRLKEELPQVRIRQVVRDYTANNLPPSAGPRLVLYLGSSIGNFEPPAAVRLLSRIGRQLGDGDAFLLGTDLRKPVPLLLAAYDDSAGVTARFNRNILARLNRELGADFDLDRFSHVAVWNETASRMEMHLESRCDQSIYVRDLRLSVRLAKGERIHTESSYKYTLDTVTEMLAAAGLARHATWGDESGWFAVHLAFRGALLV